MTMSPESRDTVLDIFRLAARVQQAPDILHFVDDEDLLLRWVEADISPDEHRDMLDHMADCTECREEIAAMVRAGALRLPEIEQVDPVAELARVQESSDPEPATAQGTSVAEPARVQPPKSCDSGYEPQDIGYGRKRAILATVAAIAATVLIGLFVWSGRVSGPAKMLALAERDLEAGNAQAALERVEGVLNEPLDTSTQARARQLLEESGYVVAKEDLAAGDFNKVLATEDRVSDRAGDSARLLNLRLQAERGIPAEYGLASAGSLLDYGYEADGSTPFKSFPTIDQTSDRLDKEFTQAIQSHPSSASLLLNRGHFLVTQVLYDEAREQFQRALALDPQNSLAHIGLGLVAFELQEFPKALEHFEAALAVAPKNLDAHINAAMTLQELGRLKEAFGHWRNVAKLAKAPDHRQRIDTRIEEIQQQIGPR